MEHEVYVPFPVGTVRQALTEPERVARCVPGVQLDADAAPGCPEGRLRLRIGSSTITYRGTLTVSATADDGAADDGAADDGAADDGAADDGAADDGAGDDGAAAVTVEAKGTEARGDGAVALSLAVRLSPATEPGPGTTLRCTGTVHRDGRLAEATDRSAASVGRRLLDRFAENLAADLRRRPVTDDAGAADDAGPDDAAAPAGDAQDAAGSRVFDTEVPPPSLDPGSDEDDGETADLEAADEAGEDLDAGEAADAFSAAHPEHAYGDEADRLAPAEAAHARRTMIGRSAEEVDHAPPRGRYAPVPAPESNGTSLTLRWAAPAAAVVLASAVVVGRVLRRRR